MNDARDLVQLGLVGDETADLEDLAQQINAEHELCAGAAHTSLEHAMKAGALLNQAKALVAHGQWGPWLEANTTVSWRTANVYMRLARELPRLSDDDKFAAAANLTQRDALAQLAEPRTPAAHAPTLWDRVTGGAPVPDPPPVIEHPADADRVSVLEDKPAPGTNVFRREEEDSHATTSQTQLL